MFRNLRIIAASVALSFIIFHILLVHEVPPNIQCDQLLKVCLNSNLSQRNGNSFSSHTSKPPKTFGTTKVSEIRNKVQLFQKSSEYTPYISQLRYPEEIRRNPIVKSQLHITQLTTTRRCQKKYDLIILVSSDPTHSSERDVIRKTWGNNSDTGRVGRPPFNPSWKTVFVVGNHKNRSISEAVSKENILHKDLILGDFEDDFYNLALKIQVGFEWSIKYCKYEYLLKADDDVFINIANLFLFLSEPSTPKTELYAGNIVYTANPQREGKYAVTEKEYSRPVYPRYASGGGFVLSRDVVERMIQHFNVVDPFKIDDVYVGMMVLKAGVDVTHNANFEMFQDDSKQCEFKRKEIVHHRVHDRECMLKLHEFSKYVETFMKEIQKKLGHVQINMDTIDI